MACTPVVGPRIRLGTRASALARWQADWVAGRLRQLGVEVLLVPITTTGDRQSEAPIGGIGGRGVFTKELQRALLEERIDLAVHSLKDLPTDEVPGLCLAAVPERGPVGDAFVSRTHPSLATLPSQAVVGTGSLRRRAQLLHVRPDLAFQNVRGNVDTRLRKLDEGQCDALILAQAGLERLGLGDRITERLAMETLLPAVGQGALGLETRGADSATRNVLEKLGHAETHAAVLAERSMLAALEGGCLAPIAALAHVDGGVLKLRGRVVHPNGGVQIDATDLSAPEDAVLLGHRVAAALTAQGAADLVRSSRQG
jgi:hydroxymethylbilane synthase